MFVAESVQLFWNRWIFGKVTSKNVHFVCLATALWKYEESGRDKHVLARKFAKYPRYVVGFLTNISPQIYNEKKLKSVNIWQNYGREFVASLLTHHLVLQSKVMHCYRGFQR